MIDVHSVSLSSLRGEMTRSAPCVKLPLSLFEVGLSGLSTVAIRMNLAHYFARYQFNRHLTNSLDCHSVRSVLHFPFGKYRHNRCHQNSLLAFYQLDSKRVSSCRRFLHQEDLDDTVKSGLLNGECLRFPWNK